MHSVMGSLLPSEFGKSLERSKSQHKWKITTWFLYVIRISMLKEFFKELGF